MASSKLMSSSTSRNADHRRRSSSASSSSTKSSSSFSQFANYYQPLTTPTVSGCFDINGDCSASMSVDGLLKTAYGDNNNDLPESTLLNAEITVFDGAIAAIDASMAIEDSRPSVSDRRTVDDAWKDLVAGKECKTEVKDDEMMTLEDFLAKAGAVEDVDVKPASSPPFPLPLTQRLSGGVFSVDISTGPYSGASQGFVEGRVMGFGNGVEAVGGRGKRSGVFEEKAAAQRQRRMIKNRESAARSRERKQAYLVELETLANKLEEENMQLLKEKALRSKERYNELMEKVVPVVDKQRPARVLRRVRSMQW